MSIRSLIYRMWYYFRIGYNTYLTFLIGFATTLVTIYYLAIKDIPSLLDIFPRFQLFAVVTLLVGVPVACLIGWYHVKGAAVWRSELDISVEANPYYYKMYPGYWKEAFTPVYLEVLKGMKKMLEKQNALDEDDKKRIEDLEHKLQTLIEGGYVGTPRARIDLDKSR
jgi:hypothetical protein